jgi:hypothetical protein
MKYMHWVGFVLIILSMLSGCKRGMDIDIRVENNDLVFSAVNYPKNKIYKLYELSVYRLDCAEDCIMWRVSDAESLPNNQKYIDVTNGVIVYGQSFENQNLKVPMKELKSGEYTVAGTVAVNKQGGRLFDRSFTLKIDESGNLSVNPL